MSSGNTSNPGNTSNTAARAAADSSVASEQPLSSQPTRQQIMQRLLAGVADDLQAYEQLNALLEEQFQAAVKHQSARLGQAAEAISALVDTMQQRRAQRVALVQRLLGAEGSMLQAFALLKNAAREKMEADWKILENKVLECKRLGKRNSDLLVEQYSIMQRVLHGEEQIYAPV